MRELKALLARRGVPVRGALERTELELKALAALSRPQPGRNVITLGGLKTILLEPAREAELVVVVFHGFNASARELAVLASVLGSATSRPLRYLVPQAHNSQWWPIQYSE